jgi:pimeloyl-ACP methyl ester carboxylesterase
MIERAGGRNDNQAVLIGHSLGGYLSLRAALQVPELTKALVLVSTGPGFRDEAAREQWNLYARSIPLDADVHPAARQMSLHSDSLVMDRLSSIVVPTLVIVGSEDRRFIGAKNYLLKKLPNSTGTEILGARHSVHQSHAIQVNEAISSFLEGVFWTTP